MVDFRFATSIHILLSLAYRARENPEALLSSAELANSTMCNPALIRQMLVPLTDAGLIETFRGKAGGVRLAKAGDKITLRCVYLACCGSQKLMLGRKDVNRKCPVGANIHSIFASVTDDVESEMLKNFKNRTIGQLLKKFVP
ncbi:MAG: Rrf2 family transcriptional regulator [Proteobacteria bacterium]|nr:MAG: Rrf2 family transcriptional regulator [Pseudomonadota bacterium]